MHVKTNNTEGLQLGVEEALQPNLVLESTNTELEHCDWAEDPHLYLHFSCCCKMAGNGRSTVIWLACKLGTFG